MELLTPGTGLIIWQAIVFGLLLFLLKKLVWKPIMQSLKIREEGIQQALDSAKNAKNEMEQLKENNKTLISKARDEQNTILKEAKEYAEELKNNAKIMAQKESDKMLEAAKANINAERDKVMNEIKSTVAELSLMISEKILTKKMESEKEQHKLVDDYLKNIKLN